MVRLHVAWPATKGHRLPLRDDVCMSIPNAARRKIRPTHPGEMLREDSLTDHGPTVAGLAKALGGPISSIRTSPQHIGRRCSPTGVSPRCAVGPGLPGSVLGVQGVLGLGWTEGQGSPEHRNRRTAIDSHGNCLPPTTPTGFRVGQGCLGPMHGPQSLAE